MWKLLTSGRTRHRPQLPPQLRVYAIGDVHGRDDLLEEMFARIDADLRRDEPQRVLEILLGDYIDRGPASRQVIDRLIARSRTRPMMFLKGNHETRIGEFLRDPDILETWQPFGGLETLVSYGLKPKIRSSAEERRALAAAFAEALPTAHRQFFSRLRPSFTCGDFFFVHAGVRPGIPLPEQREEDLLWIREEFLLCEEDFGKIVVHGHTPVRDPDIRANRINIDTGAYATGRLTCIAIEGDAVMVL